MNDALDKPFLDVNQPTSEINKYITFKLADYLFALPSEEILKIVATPPPDQGGMVSMGLVQIEQYSIQTIDVTKLLTLQSAERNTAANSHQKTATSTNLKAANNPPFLIVLQDAAQKLWGIAVDEPPDLMDIPHYALKPVPCEKRLTRALRWVSHVVTYDLGRDRRTLLVLDLSLLLAPKQPETPLEMPRGTSSFLGIEPPLETEAAINPDSEPHGGNVSARKEEMYAIGQAGV